MRHLLLTVLLSVVSLVNTAIAAPKLLFDQGHGQAFVIDNNGELQLGQLAEQFRGDGWQVTASADELTLQRLQAVDALVVSGPFRPFSGEELVAIDGFLQAGGRLAVMLHVASPIAPLLNQLGVVHANGVVREGQQDLVLEGEPLNFKVANLKPHPLTKGLEHFALYGAWPLLPEGDNTQSIANTSRSAWVDLDGNNVLSQGDAVQELSVLVIGTTGRGAFAVFGDDAIFQNKFLAGENRTLAANLSRWLQPDGAGR